MMSQQSLFNRSERDGLTATWRHLEWESLPDSHKHQVGRCEGLGEAVARGARLTAEAERLVVACGEAGLLEWLRPTSRAALERLLAARN